MKLIRLDLFFAVVLLACGAWPASSAEPREVPTNARRIRTRQQFVQVSHQEIATDATTTDLPAPDADGSPAISPEPPSPESLTEESGKTWTLVELEAVADSIHPMLQRDRARIESARGDALQAGLYPNPHFDTNNPQVFAGQNSVFNGGIMQEFVVKGKKRLDRAAATKIVQQTEFGYVQNRFILLTAIRQQFYVVLAAQVRFKVLQKLQAITSSSLETGRVLQRQAGEVAPIDVLILEVDNQRVQADLENAIRLLRGARNQLATIVGDPTISADHFEGSIYSSPPQYDEKILNQFASSNSSFVQIAKLDVERNEILLKRAVVEPYPNITLGPAYQFGLSKGNEQYWLTVTFPIPAWDRNQGGIQAAHADVAGSRRNVEAVQLEQLRRVADAYSRHRAVRAQASKYRKEIIPNTMKTLKLAQKGFAAGEYDFSRYLQVQRTVVEAYKTYIDLLENVWTSAAELSGLLQIEDFQ